MRDVSLSSAIEGYLLYADARRLSPHTISDYSNTFRRFLAFAGDIPIGDVTPNDVRSFLSSLSHLSKKTLLNYHTGLSALWSWALGEGIVTSHIVRQVAKPDPEKPAIKPYTRQDIQAMLLACDYSKSYLRGSIECRNKRPTALRDRAIVLVLLDTGLRASELGQLALDDWDRRNKRLFVWGKGSKQRIVYISPPTSQAIWRYLASRGTDSRFLFCTSQGKQFDRNNLRHLIEGLGRRSGVTNAHPHRFRHTFAIQFLRSGGNAFTLQRLLGHSTMEMVRTYLKLSAQDDSDVFRNASPVSNWRL
jgi:integrase/recombinase XerD